ncbi:hypothetical protein COCSADRAFT_353429 [Bipolaris sorokiniana ND90Pr]|uniref:Uncharacterized protein n=1 Tax=Cochliobolus sativus (strain ND90Pr / ATCC 201652) TaxID=665912 RepID=M2SVD8_COCSN|nr:uncharacterized protein COCSADRAFT_353429 [Bipolaris sorokiniana ND90Pr]EMD66275.1 hypothetical protein COCSADRAFT_353429 [Bipolaris sorokiniana ND90Pr]
MASGTVGSQQTWEKAGQDHHGVVDLPLHHNVGSAPRCSAAAQPSLHDGKSANALCQQTDRQTDRHSSRPCLGMVSCQEGINPKQQWPLLLSPSQQWPLKPFCQMTSRLCPVLSADATPSCGLPQPRWMVAAAAKAMSDRRLLSPTARAV